MLSRHMLDRSRLALALTLAAACAALAAPGATLAADAPTILTAGIDANDGLYVTWSLGAGTTYLRTEFATSPSADPFSPDHFIDKGLVVSQCVYPRRYCTGTPTTTSFAFGLGTARDRRYFVKVSAESSRGSRPLTSAVWVIDETKPLIPEGAPPRTGPPTKKPVSGKPLAGPIPPPPPGAYFSVGALPTTIGAVLRSGIRVRAMCIAATCDTSASLVLDGKRSLSLAHKRTSIASGVIHAFVLKPSGVARKRLKGLRRADLAINAAGLANGDTNALTRIFSVHR